MKINEIIRNLREDNDKTQKEIANVLETSQGYYSKYELGKREFLHAISERCAFITVYRQIIFLACPKGWNFRKDNKKTAFAK